MNAKPKRTTTAEENSIEFDTALNWEECAARLQRQAMHARKYHINVRVDHARFTVDYRVKWARDKFIVVAELSGELAPLDDQYTHVWAEAVYYSPYNHAKIMRILGIIAISLGLCCTCQAGVDYLPGLILFGGILSILFFAVFYIIYDAQKTVFAIQKVPDFQEWLFDHIYAPGESSDGELS